MDTNSMSVGIAKVQNPEIAQPQPTDWDELLNDPDQLEWLLFVARHYTDLFDTLWSDCYRLAKFDQMVYLIDFDVLRNYLEVGAVGQFDSFVLNFLFNESSQRYALPAGAFLELLDYLTDTSRKTDHLLSSVESMDPTKLLHHLATHLGVSNVGELDNNEIFEQISRGIDQRSLALDRLYKILSHQRFIGVVSSYEQNDMYRLNKIITEVPRKKEGERTKVDLRDAMNLAIAINASREARDQKRKDTEARVSCFMLLSNTRIVYDLPQVISYAVDKHEEVLANELGELHNMLGINFETPSPLAGTPVIRNFFPAMNPRQVVNAEQLGVYKNPNLTLLRSRALRDDFRKVSDYLEAKVLTTKLGDVEGYDRRIGQVLETERPKAERSLKNIAAQMLSSKSGGLQQLEQGRATSISIDYALQEQSQGKRTLQNEIRQKSTALLNLLGQVLLAMGEVQGFEYKVETDDANQYRPFDEIRVLQLPAPDGHEPLACGEKYVQSTINANRQEFYALRWPVVSTVGQFIKGIMKLVVLRLYRREKKVTNRITFSHITEESTLLKEGVIVYCNDIAFGCSLVPILGRRGWQQLRPYTLSQYLREAYTGYAKSHNLDPEAELTIQQYRVNTFFGDFIFDVQPAEDESYRFLTVISDYNLGAQIASLYKTTGMLFVIASKLEKVLFEALSQYRVLPSDKT